MMKVVLAFGDRHRGSLETAPDEPQDVDPETLRRPVTRFMDRCMYFMQVHAYEEGATLSRTREHVVSGYTRWRLYSRSHGGFVKYLFIRYSETYLQLR